MDDPEAIEQTDARPAGRGLLHRLWWLLRAAGSALFALAALLALVVAFLHTGTGRQFIVEQIARYAPASGLSVKVERIEGSVLWSSTFFNVEFRDANGVLFLQVPEIDLNWRPLKFPFGELDVRHVVLHEGSLLAVPELNPGDPDAPILPDFDIRLDRLVIEDLRVSESILGEERLVDFNAQARIRGGLAFVEAEGELGGSDTLAFLLHAQPDRDRFDLDLDYRAPAGGFLATMAGAEQDLAVRIAGDGSWSSWEGNMLATQGEERIADLRLYNTSGTYRAAGRVNPQGFLSGALARAAGTDVAVNANGGLADAVLEGSLSLRGRGMTLDAEGGLDLRNNSYQALDLEADLLDETLFGEGLRLRGAHLQAQVDGPFRDFAARHTLAIKELEVGDLLFTGLTQQGVMRREGAGYALALDLKAGKVTAGNAVFDERLRDGRVTGRLVIAGDRVQADDLAVRFAGISGQFALRGDLARGGYGLAGPLRVEGLDIAGIGRMDTDARLQARIGGAIGWQVSAAIDGRLTRMDNATLARLAGANPRFSGQMTAGKDQPLAFDDGRFEAGKLTFSGAGQVADGRTSVAGAGRHADYGPFTLEAMFDAEGPHATLVLADPLPAAGLADVRLVIAPAGEGLAITANGGSFLGRFDAALALLAERIHVERLAVGASRASGRLRLDPAGLDGTLAVTGGGLNGTVAFAPRAGGQGIDVALNAANTRFAGAKPMVIDSGRLEFTAIAGGQGGLDLTGNLRLAGVRYGGLHLSNLAAKAGIARGQGRFDAALDGYGGNRFDLQLTGAVAAERIAVAARGHYAGRAVSMPRRAVLTRLGDGGWALQPTQVGLDRGFVIAEGRFGGDAPLHGKLALANFPLSILDLASSDVGLDGRVSGVIEGTVPAAGPPTGEARLKVEGLTRSGLLLSSRPMDVALVARLRPTDLQVRSVFSAAEGENGRLEARIFGLPQHGSLPERLFAGRLGGALQYEGPAESLWRLTMVELFDVTGPVRIQTRMAGTVAAPQLDGAVTGDALEVRSATTGAEVSNVALRGRFAGSRLRIERLAGEAGNSGTVSGSGMIDFARMGGARGPQIDMRLAVRNAEVLDRRNMAATVAGPIRIVSDGIGGTIAGRLRVTRARWLLGTESVLRQLPNIATREINLPDDQATGVEAARPWRYMIDAVARDGLHVEGMGLESEWLGTISLRGTTDDPRIGGQMRSVARQSFYSFAGVRFEITRGLIRFDEARAIDPQIDLQAQSEENGLTVTVSITGSASAPDIAFNSVPALPQEEVMARLLFGESVTNLSAAEAIQLGAAVASLRSGGGMGPINRLRTAIGLDRLRILPPDPAFGRGTSIALGKKISRRIYGEIITDGGNYSATELEFRLTNWLSLLGSVNSLGRQSATVEVSRDY